MQLNGPVCRIESEAASNEETVKLLAKGVTKCLHLLHWTNPPPFSLSQSMAESLVALSVNFEPTVEFCVKFALPNLLHLTVICERGIFSPHPNSIVSAPRLRCLAFYGHTFLTDFEAKPWKLNSFFNHFDELKVLCLDVDYSKKREKIALPKSLEKLAINGDLLLRPP